jgi:hypothetical protein
MTVRFLLDENLDPRLKAALLCREPTSDVLCVGDPNTPALGTLDWDILHYLAGAGRVLVTSNRKSMPLHIAEHLAAGGHHWGVFLVRRGTALGRIAEELYLVWSASSADEWINREQHIPL